MSILWVFGFGKGRWEAKHVQRNEIGFRGPLPPKNSPEKNFRIVAIGDSMTFGAGIEKPEDRYPDLVGSILSKRLGIEIDVVNLGKCGENTFGQYHILKKYGIEFEPDIVILGYFYDDPGDKKKRANLLSDLKKPKWSYDLASKSSLFCFVRSVIIISKFKKIIESVPNS